MSDRRDHGVHSSVRIGALLCAVALAAVGCSSADDGGSSGSGGSAVESRAQQDVGANESATRDSADLNAAEIEKQDDAVSTIALQDRAIERRGSLSLTSKNVAEARSTVISDIESVGGYVADERSTTDDDGNLAHVQLQFVVPTEAFDDAMASSAGAGSVVSREQSARDVTEQVVDVDSRVENAEASLRRIRLLLGRAEKLGDVIRLESELGQREADLESLQAQQKSLEQRTTTATIDVSIRPAAKPKPKTDDEDEAGFLAGLGAGWSGLETAWTGFATVLGAVLPFVLVLGLPLVLVALLVRRTLRRRVADAA